MSKFLDSDGRLKADSQVKLRVPMQMGDGTSYRVERFGVPIPAGTQLPKTAIVLRALDKPQEDLTEAEIAKRGAAAEKAQKELDDKALADAAATAKASAEPKTASGLKL